MHDNNKVVLFPTFQMRLEEESDVAISNNDYATALEHLNTLLSHRIHSYKINVSKIVCLINLKRYSEAIQFCESILKQEDDNYYDYLDYLLIVLYEVGRYYTIIYYLKEEREKGTIPSRLQERFDTFYLLSMEMNQQEIESLLNDFRVAHEKSEYVTQWRLINRIKKQSGIVSNSLIELLTDIDTHPVIKTFIFKWLQENEESRTIQIEKFGDVIEIIPSEFAKIEAHPTYQKTLTYLHPIEQENPSLYTLTEQLLRYYIYVIYPVIYTEDDVFYVAKTIIHLAKQHLSLESNLENEYDLDEYINYITLCHQLYLNVVGE